MCQHTRRFLVCSFFLAHQKSGENMKIKKHKTQNKSRKKKLFSIEEKGQFFVKLEAVDLLNKMLSGDAEEMGYTKREIKFTLKRDKEIEGVPFTRGRNSQLYWGQIKDSNEAVVIKTLNPKEDQTNLCQEYTFLHRLQQYNSPGKILFPILEGWFEEGPHRGLVTAPLGIPLEAISKTVSDKNILESFSFLFSSFLFFFFSFSLFHRLKFNPKFNLKFFFIFSFSCSYIKNVYEALIILHTQLKFIHGDLSAGNIIIVHGNRAMLIDFELCIQIGEKSKKRGTPRFLSLALSICTNNDLHEFKQRDDFESLLFITLYWLNHRVGEFISFILSFSFDSFEKGKEKRN